MSTIYARVRARQTAMQPLQVVGTLIALPFWTVGLVLGTTLWLLWTAGTWIWAAVAAGYATGWRT